MTDLPCGLSGSRFSFQPGRNDEQDSAFCRIFIPYGEKMLKVPVPVSIGLLNDGGTICFEMDPPGVRDDQDPS